MKKFYYILFLLLPLLAMVGCTDESLYDEDPESATATLSYQISIDDDLDSRAIGDGAKVNELKVGIFQDGVHIDTQTITDKVNGKFPVELTLLKDLEYTIVFWAQAKDNGIYTLNEETFQVSIDYDKYNDISLVGTEAFEAFYATDVVKLGNNKTLTKGVDLTRPFAQLNIAAKEEEVFNKVKSTSLTIENVYTDINLLTGLPVGEAAKKTLSFEYSDEDASQKQKIEIGEEDYYYVASAYLLAPEKVKLTGSLYDGNDDVVKSFDFPEVTLKPNHRTNIYGEMIQVEVLTPWDGIIPTESTLTTDAQNRYIIDEEADLAWLSVPANMATLSENPTFIVTKDVLNMGSIEISSIQLPAGSTFEGSNKTIKNFANSLFGDVTNITVQNLVLDNVVASTNSHVGVLVNTLKGTSTFSNIAISNSSATTTEGAAGGMVGYIVRKTGTDRSETLAVTFNNCDLVGVTANGSLSEGKFVGLLSGYDNGETLTFDADCSADSNTSVTDFTSPYKTENQSVWITEELANTYDGWLGTETYRRGNVTFDGTRLVPKWDGTTTVEPLLANATYDSGTTAGTNRYVVYSPYDLAGVRKKTASPAAIYLRADIDMNGQGVDGKFNVPSNFTQSACRSTDDNVFDPFSYVTTLDGYNKDVENNYSIYNLSIAQIEQERAAFILYASGTTSHKNINFRNCQTVAVHKPVETDAKAYGAILVSNVDATYTMENVHAYDCKVFALQKVGTLGARISGTSTLTNNSVNNCYVENYECKISERFTSGKKTISRWTVEVYADFYPYGEVGGMYGFIQGNSTLNGCKVNGTTIYALGQDDKMATVDGSTTAKFGIALLGYYKVPGRHVSTLIGNIRATGKVTLTECTVDANTKCTKRHDKHNSTYNYIGQAYIVKFVDSEGSVTVDGDKLTLADCNRNTSL